jgi:hypothetical protein
MFRKTTVLKQCRRYEISTNSAALINHTRKPYSIQGLMLKRTPSLPGLMPTNTHVQQLSCSHWYVHYG